MKTDLQKFTELYSSFGITCVVNERIKGCYIEFIYSPYGTDETIQTLSNKFDGYNGFSSIIEFDKTGKFIKQSFQE